MEALKHFGKQVQAARESTQATDPGEDTLERCPVILAFYAARLFGIRERRGCRLGGFLVGPGCFLEMLGGQYEGVEVLTHFRQDTEYVLQLVLVTVETGLNLPIDRAALI